MQTDHKCAIDPISVCRLYNVRPQCVCEPNLQLAHLAQLLLCICILYFLNLLYYTYEKYWFDEFLPEIRNCTSCAGVCRAYLIVHLKCTQKSSKMLCGGKSSRSLLPAFPNHNPFFHFLSLFSLYRLHYL
jgi:hypothetical protein